jgi:hypothetical protein
VRLHLQTRLQDDVSFNHARFRNICDGVAVARHQQFPIALGAVVHSRSPRLTTAANYVVGYDGRGSAVIDRERQVAIFGFLLPLATEVEDSVVRDRASGATLQGAVDLMPSAAFLAFAEPFDVIVRDGSGKHPMRKDRVLGHAVDMVALDKPPRSVVQVDPVDSGGGNPAVGQDPVGDGILRVLDEDPVSAGTFDKTVGDPAVNLGRLESCFVGAQIGQAQAVTTHTPDVNVFDHAQP